MAIDEHVHGVTEYLGISQEVGNILSTGKKRSERLKYFCAIF